MESHVALLKALADPTRLKLLKLLLREELCVCELVELLRISQPAVSQHIAKLRPLGLIQERRAGQWTYYTADAAAVHREFASFMTFLGLDLADIPAMAGEWKRRQRLIRAQACGEQREDLR